MKRRTRASIATLLLVLSLTVSVFGPAPAANARVIRTAYKINITCTSTTSDGYCEPPKNVGLKTRKKLNTKFVASSAHCTPIGVYFLVIRRSTGDVVSSTGRVVNPGESSGIVPLGPVPRGRYLLRIRARDEAGGCVGPLSSWSGKLKIWTTR